MPSLLRGSTIATIKKLRVDGWLTARASADPQLSITFVRVDETTGDETTLPAQDVVVDWHTALVPGPSSVNPGEEPLLLGPILLTFRRPTALVFDVTVGDRFSLQQGFGIVLRVYENAGMTYAECSLDEGAP